MSKITYDSDALIAVYRTEYFRTLGKKVSPSYRPGWFTVHGQSYRVSQFKEMIDTLSKRPSCDRITGPSIWKLGDRVEPDRDGDSPQQWIDLSGIHGHGHKILVNGQDCAELATRIVKFLNDSWT